MYPEEGNVTRIATTPGLFPLPDWAKTSLTEAKGRQKSDLNDGNEPDDVTEIYDRARQAVVDRQRTAGLDRIVDGQLRWDDMLAHPLTVHDAVETGGLVRYFDNNNFYRDPAVTSELTADGDVAVDLTAAAALLDDDPIQAVLPGPVTLADLATDDYYGDPDTFLSAIAEFLATEIDAFPPVDTLFLLEPSLAFDSTVADPEIDATQTTTDAVLDAAEITTDAIINAIETVTAPIGSDTDVVVHSYWGTVPDEVYTGLLDVDVGVGYDLVTAADDVTRQVGAYGAPSTIALGVLDGQNTRVESLEEIDAAIENFEAVAGPADTTYVTTNTEPFYLPTKTFEAKLDRLARATTPREVSP